MTHRVLLLTAGLLLLGPMGTARAQSFIEDTEMPVSNWQADALNPVGGFSFTVGQSSVGGNPDAYRSIGHTSVDGNASGLVVHRHVNVWVPARQGSIDSLEMGLDVNCINGGTSGAVGFGLLVVQNGLIYFGPSFTPLNNSGWRTDLHSDTLDAASFSAGGPNPNPDFSVNGSTITFGFYSSNGTASGTPIGSSSGADNFIVRIIGTPPPDAGVAPDAEPEIDAGEVPDAEPLADAEPAPDAEPAADAALAPDAAAPADGGSRPDGGARDSGPRSDSSITVDAGGSEVTEEGCTCRSTASAPSGSTSLGLLLLTLGLFVSTRRRRPSGTFVEEARRIRFLHPGRPEDADRRAREAGR